MTTEQDKANKDLLQYGQSFMLGGKHIPIDGVLIKPAMTTNEMFEETFKGKLSFKRRELSGKRIRYAESETQYKWEGWQAATTEANKRIEALEGEVAELKAVTESQFKHMDLDYRDAQHLHKQITELQAHINNLREALKLFKKEAESYGETWARCYVADFDRIAVDSKKVRFDLLAIQQDRLKSFADALLSATPAESLQAFKEVK